MNKVDRLGGGFAQCMHAEPMGGGLAGEDAGRYS